MKKNFCYIFVFIACLLPGSTCTQSDQNDNKMDSDMLLANLYGVWITISGDCLHSSKMADNAGLFHCSRTARVNCNTSGKLDLPGRLIVTAASQNRYRADWTTLVDLYPDCQTTMASLLVNSAFKKTSQADVEEINTRNNLKITGNCENIGATDVNTLISNSSHTFYITPRAQMARQALLLSQTSCYQSLIYHTSESDLLEALDNNSLLAQTSCRYGTQSAVLLSTYTACSQSEIDQVWRFDFDTF